MDGDGTVGGTGSSDGDRARDPGLQPERTSLAWRRTGLALTTVAIALLRISVTRDAAVVGALSAALAVIALGALIEGSVGHGQRRRWFEADRTRTGLPFVARATVVTAVGVSAIGLLLVVTT